MEKKKIVILDDVNVKSLADSKIRIKGRAKINGKKVSLAYYWQYFHNPVAGWSILYPVDSSLMDQYRTETDRIVSKYREICEKYDLTLWTY